jgi:hypothetical protein
MITRAIALLAIIVPVTAQAQGSFPCTPRTGSGNTFGIEEINELWSLIQGSRTPREAESKVGDRFGSTPLTFVETIENKKISIIIDQIGMDSINQLTRAPFLDVRITLIPDEKGIPPVCQVFQFQLNGQER